MALAACRECSAEISTEAEECPKCGAKMPTTAAAYRTLVSFVLALAGIAALFVYHRELTTWAEQLLFS